jgi:hypothetical protein
MAEYSRLAKGSFTAGASQTSAVIQLPFLPDYVEVWNLTNIGAAASAGNILRAYWDNNIPAYTPSGKSASQTMVEVYNATPAVIYDTIYTNGVTGGTAPASGISTFQGALELQYGATLIVSSVSKASQAVVTTSTNHGYAVGDTVIMQGIATTVTTNAMRLLNTVPFTIVAVTSNTFTINWNTNLANYSAASTAGTVKKVLYPFLYLPEDNVISAITLGTTTTIATTMYHNFEPGQEIAFRIPSFWGTTQLNSLPNNVIPGQPIYGYVLSVTDNWTFVVSINSSSYTAYNAFGNASGTIPTNITYPQVLAIGDVNTGGIINNLSVTNLYPAPQFPTSTNRVSTINGPAIRGAFVNNTSQGFIIGNGTPQEQAGTGTIVTANSIILWHAYAHDYANP